MDGIGPSDLNFGTLMERMTAGNPKEIILALSSTMEGDTTAYFLYKKLDSYKDLKITTLSRGVPIGDELQYADELTLGRSIVQRLPYDKALR
jgi:recombination protein RecR